jgi:ubiquinone/menaquinone biosynthesis C-methylase UbiE
MTNGHITGVDISLDMLEVARKECQRYENIDIVQGNIRQLDFIEDESVDFILCAWVVQHLISLKDFRKGFDELARVTRAGGTVLIAEDLPPTNPLFSKCLVEKDEYGGMYFYEDRYEGMSLPVYRRLLNKEEMTRAIREAGFTVSDYKEKISLGAYVACRR